MHDVTVNTAQENDSELALLVATHSSQ